ncbi:hypothetical protein CALVIDRAFT_544643 [Calocera viscosa TUFC12733]|uniref:Heparinase II/III-like C-terminal domain-containing protein n=1 Tax=Calocera viscosa (strain TUFC12733) TaxID=1330018 RepID=A0A167PHB3_CALVF|nr:hypothetical protein CALVIDRAFT_544643 [Calocera viscosa TUFC12733]
MAKPGPHRTRNLIVAGTAAVIIVALALGLGLGLGLKHNNSSSSAAASSGGSSGGSDGSGGSGAPGSQSSPSGVPGRFAVATDTWGHPIYPTATGTSQYSAPTIDPASAIVTWPSDPFQPQSPSLTQVRTDRPRLIAPSYKWDALPGLIAKDSYLAGWNATIFGNATVYAAGPLTNYSIDGGLGESGVLDVARQVKVKVKSWAYAYRMSNDSSWVDRTWDELVNAAGNNSANYFGVEGDNWNDIHFLDLAEFTAAYAIAYDWMYDAWSDDQRTALMWSILNLGLSYGVTAYTDASYGNGWWRSVNGNWNCVCNSGLTMGALAILGDDPTGTAAQILSYTVSNAQANCAQAPSSDGTWSETANYWYFGTMAFAEMTSSLMTATGSDQGMFDANPTFNLTGLYHMYVTGMTSLFNYGDCGPNKYSTNANGMMLFGEHYNAPRYMLFQRDQFDAAEPWGMFWYDPAVSGAWWEDLALDHYFDDEKNTWASMRSSWTDNTGLYIAMKAGNLTDHQTHGDLDSGDFVLDAMEQRWAGELGSGDYDAPYYFSSEAQNSARWTYYRKASEGQNTLLLNEDNQNVEASPTGNFGSSGTAQGASTEFTVPSDSTAFFTADLTTTYNGTSFQRGIRMLNGRKQVLLQDDINAPSPIIWRMHTNATVSIDTAGTTATLSLGGQTMSVQLINAPSGAAFSTMQPVRFPTDPPLPAGAVDQPNPGVTVLAIQLGAGQYSLQVLFNPQWPGLSSSDYVTPPSVAVTAWTLTSHD